MVRCHACRDAAKSASPILLTCIRLMRLHPCPGSSDGDAGCKIRGWGLGDSVHGDHRGVTRHDSRGRQTGRDEEGRHWSPGSMHALNNGPGSLHERQSQLEPPRQPDVWSRSCITGHPGIAVYHDLVRGRLYLSCMNLLLTRSSQTGHDTCLCRYMLSSQTSGETIFLDHRRTTSPHFQTKAAVVNSSIFR